MDFFTSFHNFQHFFPHRVEKHNYQAASSRQGKLTNWATLNRKVLAKFGFTVPADVVESIIAAKPNVVEVFLNGLKQIIDRELNAELEQVSVVADLIWSFFMIRFFNLKYWLKLII